MSKNAWNFDADRRVRNLYFDWAVTQWCNYQCSYCFYRTHRRGEPYNRPSRRNPLKYLKYLLFDKKYTVHSFDNYPAEQWIERIAALAENRKMCLQLSGGEIFLDKENIFLVLKELLALPAIDHIRADTNATFDPSVYKGLDLARVFLSISYHPQHTDIDRLFAKVKAIRDAGFQIGVVNFVMARSQRDKYEEAKEKFWQIGVYVNPNPCIDRQHPDIMAEDYEYYRQFLAEFDLKNKTNFMDLKHTWCHYPQIGLHVSPDGAISNACFNERRANLFRSTIDEINALLTEGPTLCPRTSCERTNMYSFQCGQCRNHESMEILGNYTNEALIGYRGWVPPKNQ